MEGFYLSHCRFKDIIKKLGSFEYFSFPSDTNVQIFDSSLTNSIIFIFIFTHQKYSRIKLSDRHR